MTLHRIRVLIFAVMLSALLLASGVGGNSTARSAAPSANWAFEGCWTQFSAGPCRDIFRDNQGNFWICRACGTTGNPGPGKCNPISPATLASGFWCS